MLDRLLHPSNVNRQFIVPLKLIPLMGVVAITLAAVLSVFLMFPLVIEPFTFTKYVPTEE